MTLDTARLRKLLDRISPGEWEASGSFEGNYSVWSDEDQVMPIASGLLKGDAAFLVAAVNALPALLDRVEALERDIGVARQAVRDVTNDYYSPDHGIRAERDQLAARVAKLEAALRRYGTHVGLCAEERYGLRAGPATPPPCTCGLDAALSEKP